MPNLRYRTARTVPAPLVICLCAALFVAGAAHAQTDVRLRAERQSLSRVPVEIRTCQTGGDATSAHAEQIESIMESDLWLSSLIAAFRGSPANGQDTTASPYASLRPGLTIRTALESRFALAADRFVLEINLLNIFTRRRTHEKRYEGCLDHLRLVVHKAMDDVVTALTGSKGIAASRIAFTGESFGAKELYVMDYDGVNLRKITSDDGYNLTPAWTPNGRGLIYTSYQRGNPDLFALDLNSGKASPVLQANALYTSAAVSDDGRRLAYVSTEHGNAEIYVRDLRAGKTTRLTRHGAIDTSPGWSPDGSELVFSSDRSGKPQLYFMAVDGSDVRRLPAEGDYSDSPTWSPRGDKIAYVVRNDGVFDIYIYDILTSSALRLTEASGSNEDPAWSPDGYRIAFSSTREGSRDIYSMMWDGSHVEKLTVKGTCSSPAWSPNVRPASDFLCQD